MATFGFEYRKNNSGIVIEKYIGEDSIVDVPSKISGLPVVEMSAGAFDKCKNLRRIFLPDSLKSIDEQAFAGCTSLTEIYWHDTLIKISGQEFKISTGSPTEINLPRFLIHLGETDDETISTTDNPNVTDAEKIPTTTADDSGDFKSDVAEKIPAPTNDDLDDFKSAVAEKISPPTNDDLDDFKSAVAERISPPINDDIDDDFKSTVAKKFWTTPVEQFKYSKNNWGIVIEKYLGEDSVVIVPNEIDELPVLVIGNGAFQNRKDLTAVHLPESLQTINDWAFGCCRGLTEIRFPDDLKFIGGAAFWNCTGLTEIHFPAYLQVISWWAFEGCTNLADVYFPVGLQQLGAKAFVACPGLKNFYVPKNLAENMKSQIHEVLPVSCEIHYV